MFQFRMTRSDISTTAYMFVTVIQIRAEWSKLRYRHSCSVNSLSWGCGLQAEEICSSYQTGSGQRARRSTLYMFLCLRFGCEVAYPNWTA